MYDYDVGWQLSECFKTIGRDRPLIARYSPTVSPRFSEKYVFLIHTGNKLCG